VIGLAIVDETPDTSGNGSDRGAFTASSNSTDGGSGTGTAGNDQR
jgi:hypothetical protein